MSIENPDSQENVVEEDPTKEIRERIVDEAFGSFDNIMRFMNQHYGWFEKKTEEEKIEQAKREKEGFAESLNLDPRFGSEEEYFGKIREEMEKLSSPERKLVFLQGLTDFRRGSHELKSIHDKFEKAKERKEPPKLEPTDEILVRGMLFRSIMDTNVNERNVISDIKLAKKLEETTVNKQTLEYFRPDFERMLNEGTGMYKTNELDSMGLMAALNQVGMNFKWSQNAEGEKVFLSETEQEPGSSNDIDTKL